MTRGRVAQVGEDCRRSAQAHGYGQHRETRLKRAVLYSNTSSLQRPGSPHSLSSQRSRSHARTTPAAQLRPRDHRHTGHAGDERVISCVLAVGHHGARHPRRPRRVEAGSAANTLFDAADGPAPRPSASQVRTRRRRHHGSLSSPRRQRDLRDARAHGAVLRPQHHLRRPPGQLRLARRSARGLPLHRVPLVERRPRDAERARRGDRRPPAYLRRRDHRADLPAGIAAQPARQRHHRHRGRHGNEHAHAQPARGVRSDRARAQQTPAAAHHRGAHGRAPRPRLPERRHRHRREHPRRLRDRPGHRAHPCPHRGREAHPHARRARRHRAPLSRGPRTRRGPHQGAPQGQQAQRCSGRQEPVRPQARLEDPDRTTRRRRPATRHERAV
ncbi:unannotated protein [freshwater metagenome]|uniref:Unannotated protein n=1 Tax=freshwater metagenome TaxID=449393 RepID=A0A6J7IQ96_9ZZZZ